MNSRAHEQKRWHMRCKFLALTLTSATVVGTATPSLADPPKAQDKWSMGAEIEGLIWVVPTTNRRTKKPYKLEEKSEWVPTGARGALDPVGALSPYGMPYITLELDQVFTLGGGRNTTMQATGEIVTSPLDATAAGIEALLEKVQTLCKNNPKAQLHFKRSADGWGAPAIVRPAKWCTGSMGAPQINITVPATKLLGAGSSATWALLSGDERPVVLATAAAELANDLTGAGGPLAAYAAKKTEIGLWMLAWMSAMSSWHAQGKLAKDFFGATMKMKIDPASSGVDAAAGAIFAALPADGPIGTKAKTAVTTAIAGGGGAALAWSQGMMELANRSESIGTERPLATRTVGGVIGPIVESRSNGTALNMAFQTAYLSVIRGTKTPRQAATTFWAVVQPLFQ